MPASEQITVVVQAHTEQFDSELLSRLQHQLPRAQFIVALAIDDGVGGDAPDDPQAAAPGQAAGTSAWAIANSGANSDTSAGLHAYSATEWPCVRVAAGHALPAHEYGPRAQANRINDIVHATQAALAQVQTPYVLTIDASCRVEHSGWLELYERYGANKVGDERLMISSDDAIDPVMFQTLPFHLSLAWVFGPTSLQRQLWAAPRMSLREAVWYDTHAYSAKASVLDRRFRSRFSPSQHVWSHFAASQDVAVPMYHNDLRPTVLHGFARFVAHQLLIVDADQAGVHSASGTHLTVHAQGRGLQSFNALRFADWAALQAQFGEALDDADWQPALWARRHRVRSVLSRLFHRTQPLHPMLAGSALMRAMDTLLLAAHRWSVAEPRALQPGQADKALRPAALGARARMTEVDVGVGAQPA